jgi:hypothetical protein
MRRLAPLLALAALLAAAAPAQSEPRFEPVAGSYSAPIYLTAPPRDTHRVFVVERGGLVKVVRDGVALSEPFIDLTGLVTTDGERGLLSMAFPPDYETSGLVYTYLTGPAGQLQIREHQRADGDPDATVPGSRLVWAQDHADAANHNGGQIQFGPDGLLWVAPGDGGGGNDVPNNAQRLDTQLGKMLRIDPRPGGGLGHSIPPDNPFAAQGDGAVDTIWSTGLRNPFRFSFDRVTGDLFIGDVGQGAREEIDLAPFSGRLGDGADYGWRCREGSIRTPDVAACEPRGPYIAPFFDYERTAGRTVTGGVVVRDPGLPTLLGRYLYVDFFRTELRSLAPTTPGGDDRAEPDLAGAPATRVVAFGEDACGNVYVVSIDGPVSRLEDTGGSDCVLTPAPRSLPARPTTGTPGGGGGGGGGGGAQPGPGPAADTRRPSLRVRVSGKRSLAPRRRLRVAVTSDEPATVRVTGRLRGVARFKTARRQLAANRRTVLNVRITRKAARKLRRTLRRKRVVAALTVRAHDAAGNQRRVSRRVTIKRR